MMNEKSRDNLQHILNFVSSKYENGGKYKAIISFLGNDLIAADIAKNPGEQWAYHIYSIDEFYVKHLHWIKEKPEYHTIFMSEILGKNDV